MKILYIFVVLLPIVKAGNLICYYDSSSYSREGPAKLSLRDMEPALQFCNYVMYGYAGIDIHNFQISTANVSVDVMGSHWRQITDQKYKHPQLRVLLSVGGDKDKFDELLGNQYLLVLEDVKHRQAFISSAVLMLKTYGFDGLDLAWQFPKSYPKEVKSGFKKAWGVVKGWFTGEKVVDERAEEHKEQFTVLVRELRLAFRQNGLLLTLTMLPHVNPALFIDIPAVINQLDFVNLATFDFFTPTRDPKIADYPAPLYEMFERNPGYNIDYQVQYWLNNSAPANRINIGVAAYGRSWVMTRDSGITGYPPIPDANGPAPGGRYTLTPGLLSWPEICEHLSRNKDLTGANAPLRKVGDPTQRYGTYAYRAADDNGEHGMWVGYEDPTTAATKAGYVNAKVLGGVALFDLSMDDFRGECAGERFPILRSIKYKL